MRTPPKSLGDCLRELAEPWHGGEKVKVAINRAARLAGLSYWRAFDIWYGKARRIEQFEADAIAGALEQKNREAARRELQELRTKILRLESMLETQDADFYRPHVDAARYFVRKMDGKSGA